MCHIRLQIQALANFDKRLSSTIFLIGFQIASSLGICARFNADGHLDHAGYQTVFFAISGIVLPDVAIGIFFLE
ncbi:MFS transporter [Escherichia coli]